MKDWNYLTQLAGGKAITIKRVTIADDDGISIDGEFGLPPLARLDSDDQVFAAVFIKCHGSIKQMEKHFGISYPTVKNRLNKIGAQLDFVNVETVSDRADILERLDRGEISVDQAIDMLGKNDPGEKSA